MSSVHPVSQYAIDVLEGRHVVGRLAALACKRDQRDRAEGEARDIRFDEDLADHAISYFPKFLRHNEGLFAGEPFVLSPHQQFIVGSLFGWVRISTGYRRFRHAYIEEGKGDGKSPLAAGMALYGLTMDGEQGAEIYCAAVTRDQAGIAFRDCVHMAEKSVFANRLTIGKHNIAYPATNSFIRPVSSEARSLDGKRVFMAILDEVHEHSSPLVIDKMVAGFKGRTQPLGIEITNSGYDRTSICWEHHEYSRQLLEEAYQGGDDTWFAYICQLDVCHRCISEGKSSPQDDCADCDHWWEEKNWIKANPNIGKSVTYDYLRSEVDKALRMPTKALTVKRLNFCIWTESNSHWLSMDDWDACALNITRESLKGRLCFAGLDLADSSDTASLVLCFPPTGDDDPYIFLSWCWIPAEMKKRTGQERARFENWIAQGFIIGTPGNVIDYSYILSTIGTLREQYNIKMLGFDRWGAGKLLADLCDEYGFTEDEKEAKGYRKPLIVKMGQGFASMSSPVKEFANFVSTKRIAHLGDPVMRWQISNVWIEQDGAGNQKINKGKSTEKVDIAVAAVMALDLAVRNPQGTGSVYNDRGLLIL